MSCYCSPCPTQKGPDLRCAGLVVRLGARVGRARAAGCSNSIVAAFAALILVASVIAFFTARFVTGKYVAIGVAIFAVLLGILTTISGPRS